MEVEAIARYMRIPPRKARLVAATVVGLPVKEALTVLDFTPRSAAKEVAKVVKSAAANATNNFNQDEDALFVKSIVVDEGPTLKRGRARARGMYFSIFKRTSHITAVVDTREVAATTRRRRAAAAGVPAGAPGTRARASASARTSSSAKGSKSVSTPEKAAGAKPKALVAEREAAPEVVEAIEAEAAAVIAVEEAKAEVVEAVRAEEAEEEAAETTVVPVTAEAESQPTERGEEQATEKGVEKATDNQEASEQADPEKENA
jgi:large subunit ribosomal protein L22